MDEKKIKIAFNKIKQDINFLKSQIESLKNNLPLETEIETENKNFKKLKEEFNKLKEKVIFIDKKPENNYLDIKTIDRKFNDFEDMLNKKLDIEISSLKINLNSKLEELNQNIFNIKKEPLNKILDIENIDKKIQNTFNQFSEIIDEKISIEINALKLEFTEEIGKLYDKFFSEIVEFKNELNKINEKTLIDEISKKEIKQEKKDEKKIESKKNTKNFEEIEKKPKKEGKIKKIAKWLFIDEEEDFEELKDEVKKKDD